MMMMVTITMIVTVIVSHGVMDIGDPLMTLMTTLMIIMMIDL